MNDIVKIYKMYGGENEMINYRNNYSKMLSEIKIRLDNIFLIRYPNINNKILNSLFAIYSYENFSLDCFCPFYSLSSSYRSGSSQANACLSRTPRQTDRLVVVGMSILRIY